MLELDINYINELLKQGMTVKEVRSELGVSEKLFQKEIKRLGYKYNQKTKQYDLIDYKDNIKVIDCKSSDYESNTKIIHDKDYKSNTNVIDKNKELDVNKVADLIEDYDTLKSIIKWFKDKENTIDRIVIDLPDAKDKRTTILINEIIYNQFNEFCNNHKEYSKKDLMAMSLLEYIRKYN